MKNLIIIITFHVSLFTIHLSVAQIIHVPAGQPTIQAGINAATDGDTVLVANGTYIENINYMGKAITVASHFLMDGDTNHINSTIIDGSQSADPNNGSVVTLITGEDTTSVLCGFTISGGNGLFIEAYQMRIGGGVVCYYAGLKLTSNKITGNSITHAVLAGGGGVACYSENNGNWFVARDNLIFGNTCTSMSVAAFAGGVYAASDLVFHDNEIYGNTCTGITEAQANGGGMLIEQPSGTLFAFDLRDNNIHENNCKGNDVEGAGVWILGGEGTVSGNRIMNNAGTAVNLGSGGGMFLLDLNGMTDITGNEFSANRLEGYYVDGGGLKVANANDKVNILNNSFEQNTLNGSDKAFGGGLVLIQNHEVSISNNHFQGNVLQGGLFSGAGMSVSGQLSKTEIMNNRFSSNSGSGTGFGGGLSLFDSYHIQLEIDGNIFENNDMNAGGGLFTYNCYNVLVSNNVFAGNHALLVGGGFRLRHYIGRPSEVTSLVYRLGNHPVESNINHSRTVDHPLLINNTFINNTSAQGGAIYCDHEDEFPLIVNSVFWENEATYGDNIYYQGEDSLLVSFCNINTSFSSHIYGKWKGTDNFSEVPGFIDGMCHIDENSPCLDAGTDSLEFEGVWYHAPLNDFEGTIRPLGNGIDIGADESNLTGVEEYTIQNSSASLRIKIQSYPNPTSGITDFRLLIADFGRVTMKISDMHGCKVADLLDDELPAGEHAVQFDTTRLPDGIYLVRMQSGEDAVTKKIVIIH